MWPTEQLKWCSEAGVFRWFVPREYGGWEWNDIQQLEGYLQLSRSCMTTAFILTQWNAACKRLSLSTNETIKKRWLPALASGEAFATVGISHLTTSRQHLSSPVLSAIENADGSFTLQGFSPWVTAAPVADVYVVGATLPDDQQILCAVPRQRSGIEAGPGVSLQALSASRTDRVTFHEVRIEHDEIVLGKMRNIMQAGAGGAGGLQTSTLAIGLAHAAAKFLMTESQQRAVLKTIAEKLFSDVEQLQSDLFAIASGQPGVTAARLREQANSLVLRATQAALGAAKGAGFVSGHPAGRWCREALFFLVWSCPQPVLAANLCEFAQV